MQWLTLLVILAAQPEIGDVPPTEEVVVYSADFGPQDDKNFDGWPDNWSRRRGAGYPVFLKALIVDEPQSQGRPAGRALRLQLDGGGLAVFTPHIPVSPLFGYRARGQLRTEGLSHDVAYLSLAFYDAQGKLLERHESHHVTSAPLWTPAGIGPVLPKHQGAATAVIGLHLCPSGDHPPDLKGAALFGDLRLTRLPRLALSTNRRSAYEASSEPLEVVCQVSGVQQASAKVAFRLEDQFGRTLAVHLAPLEEVVTVAERFQQSSAGHHAQPMTAASPASMKGYNGRAVWKPPVAGYGFYRIVASLEDEGPTRLTRATSIVVARDIDPLSDGEFGWSLPRGDDALSLAELVPLVSSAGLRWLKLPLWYDAGETARADQLAWFVERVSLQKIEVVGVLDQPPPSLRKSLGQSHKLPVATVFVEDALWKPAIDPVMTRLSLKVRHWQLGADDDASFVGLPQLEAKIAQLKQHFLKFGQESRLSLPWPWLHEPPRGAGVPWDALTRTAQPALTERELSDYLAAEPEAGRGKWMTLEPLPKDRYLLATRARDLIKRMLAAKRHGAQAVFVPNPFDPQQGLVHHDGSPGELFLPWRHTALLVGGSQYLGSIQLPGGSTNHLFRRGQEAVMVVWNDAATRETLYLGDRIEHFDPWGTTLPLTGPDERGEQTIEVGPVPTFVTGLDLAVAKWRISFAFDSPSLPSVFGREQVARYTFRNGFGQGVDGEIRIISPGDWEVSPAANSFKAADAEEGHGSFVVRFKPDAECGPQRLRFDVRLTAQRNYAFSVYQYLNVGAEDVYIQTATRENDRGQLVVEQTFVNDTDEVVSFNCLLFAPGRRRQRVQVVNLGRGRQTSTFVLTNADQLTGQTLTLRAEEINGDRVLNYRILPDERETPGRHGTERNDRDVAVP